MDGARLEEVIDQCIVAVEKALSVPERPTRDVGVWWCPEVVHWHIAITRVSPILHANGVGLGVGRDAGEIFATGQESFCWKRKPKLMP